MLSKIPQFTFLMCLWLLCHGGVVFSGDNPLDPHIMLKCENMLKAQNVQMQPSEPTFFLRQRLEPVKKQIEIVLPTGVLDSDTLRVTLFNRGEFQTFLATNPLRKIFNYLGFSVSPQNSGVDVPSVDHLKERLDELRKQGVDFPFDIISVPPGEVEPMQWRRFLSQRILPLSQWDKNNFKNTFFVHDMLSHLPGVLFLPSEVVDQFQGNIKVLFMIYDFLTEEAKKESNSTNLISDTLQNVKNMIIDYGRTFELYTGFITSELMLTKPSSTYNFESLNNFLKVLSQAPRISHIQDIELSLPRFILQYFANRLRPVSPNQRSLDKVLLTYVEQRVLAIHLDLKPLSNEELIRLTSSSLNKMKLLHP